MLCSRGQSRVVHASPSVLPTCRAEGWWSVVEMATAMSVGWRTFLYLYAGVGLILILSCCVEPLDSKRLRLQRRGRKSKEPPSGPSHVGLAGLPVSIPLKEQPNMSSRNRQHEEPKVIQGSRKAFTVTKMTYLKKEWCKTEPLKQVIREDGCLKSTIINRFCYGQCNSFFIPKSEKGVKKDLETAAFKSCSFCKPKRHSWITVTLRCPSKIPRFRRKRVQRIKQCRCMAQKLS